jgi:hypothetical protein
MDRRAAGRQEGREVALVEMAVVCEHPEGSVHHVGAGVGQRCPVTSGAFRVVRGERLEGGGADGRIRIHEPPGDQLGSSGTAVPTEQGGGRCPD